MRLRRCTHLKLRLLVKTVEALAAHEQPVLAQLQVDHPDAAATMALAPAQTNVAGRAAERSRNALALIRTTAGARCSLSPLSTI